MSLNNSEFDDVRQDRDADEPMDGRDGQPAPGTPDAPQGDGGADPLHGVQQILEQHDEESLELNPETLLPEPDGRQGAADESELAAYAEELEQEPDANLPDQRQDPDQQ
jgi:hypothetical protein